MSPSSIQASDMSGKTKLTAVTVGHGSNKKQCFVMLEHDEKGSAKLPMTVLDKILDEVKARRGDTVTVG